MTPNTPDRPAEDALDMQRRKDVYDTEPFKIIEYALQKQGVKKALTDEFYSSVIEMDNYIRRYCAERERALLERLKAQEQPWYPNRDTGKLEKCVPLQAIDAELARLKGDSA